MNREIKFRAWDCHANRMIVFENDTMWDTNWLLTCYAMQYTGLKDKNGKEIYEGDILGRIGFFHKVVINDGTNFYSYSVNNPQSIFILNKFSIDGYDEIIGNIYENPELLK
jgi:uncharacterized phage protein (TIGR01671 family)